MTYFHESCFVCESTKLVTSFMVGAAVSAPAFMNMKESTHPFPKWEPPMNPIAQHPAAAAL